VNPGIVPDTWSPGGRAVVGRSLRLVCGSIIVQLFYFVKWNMSSCGGGRRWERVVRVQEDHDATGLNQFLANEAIVVRYLFLRQYLT
jgi:hypothetical protein